jgi:hypothetical protein
VLEYNEALVPAGKGASLSPAAVISTVCEAVLPFSDPLPESVFLKLFAFLHMEHTVLKGELDADPSYSTAAGGC